MEQTILANWIEAVGWAASLLTIATYSMNTMIPLRIFAIGSSFCFLIYSFVLQLWPMFAMDLILLPINLYRFWQILSLRRRVLREGETDAADFSVIKAYGTRGRVPAGTAIFEKGDPVDRLYYLSQGRVMVDGADVELGPGDIFGEIAFFTDAASRTATVRAVEDVEVWTIDKPRFMTLQFEDPAFGLSIMRTITRRLIANATAAQSTGASA